MYIPRKLKKTFQSALRHFPAVLITGPRQSGKTTFLKHETKDISYVTFDDPLSRDYALKDANGFLDQFKGNPVILDEIQYVPELLQYIKMRIDRKRTPGVWIMTGSQQFHLMKNISETLAGRIAILELGPFNLQEGRSRKKNLKISCGPVFSPSLPAILKSAICGSMHIFKPMLSGISARLKIYVTSGHSKCLST